MSVTIGACAQGSKGAERRRQGYTKQEQRTLEGVKDRADEREEGEWRHRESR